MAAGMKATLQIDADAKGVARGVAAARNELDKLNRAAGATAVASTVTAALTAAQTVAGVVGQAIRALNQRADELGQNALAWSPDAINAQAKGESAAMDAQRRIGIAIGPGQAAVEKIRAEAAQREAARVQANAPGIAGGMAALASVGEDASSAWNAARDAVGGAIGGDFSQGPFSAAYQATGAGEFWGEVGNEMLAQLRQIARLLQGGG